MIRFGQTFRLCRWVFGCTALLMASPAFAEKPAKPTLVVAPLKARGTSAQDAAVLGDMLRSRIINIGSYQVVTPEEMEAIDAELQRQLSGGCDEASCISELAGALGAQFLITGSLDRIGSQTVVTLKMIEIERVRATGSVMARAPNIDGILTQIETMLGKLFKVKSGGDPVASKPGIVVQPTPPKAPASKVKATAETVGQKARKKSVSLVIANAEGDLALLGLQLRVGRPKAWGLVLELGAREKCTSNPSDTASDTDWTCENALAGGVGLARQFYQLGPVEFVADALIGQYGSYDHFMKARILARLGDWFPFELGLPLYFREGDWVPGVDASLGFQW